MRFAVSLVAGALLASAAYPQRASAQQEPASPPAAPAVDPAPPSSALTSDVPYAPANQPAALSPIPQAALAVPAPAAEPPTQAAAAEPEKQKVEEIVVTGSRIRRKDLTTPAPVTMLNKEQIAASGKVSIGDFLQSIPEQGNATNTSVNNGGDGSTRISLRNLGTGRTLVLLNGRRMVPGGTGADSSVDLNSLPVSAIERIEILKDGASAIYGSDAIAGVVNIITKKRFEGVEASIYAGSSTHGDGSILDVSTTIGTASEKGSLMFSAGYYKQQPVWGGDRTWSNPSVGYDATGENNPQGQGPGEYRVADSNTVPAGSFSVPAKCTDASPLCAGKAQPNPNNDPKIALYNELMTKYPDAEKFIRDPSAPLGWRPFVSDLLPEEGGDGLNVRPDNYLVTPQQRISLFSTGEYRFNDSTRAFFEASFVNRQSVIKLAPEPFVGGAYDFATDVSADSIYNPFGVKIENVQRRLVEFGTRNHEIEINTARVVMGVDGTLPESAGFLKGWFWDLSLNYGRTAANETDTGSLLLPNIAQAVGPSFIDPKTGVATCGTLAEPISGCVPLNLFGGPGTISSDMIRNLTYAGNISGTNQLVALQANANGEILRLPWTDRATALAFGYEHRRLTGTYSPDPIAAAGYSTNGASAPTTGGYYVNEGYAELSIPIVSRVPFAEILEASAAIRAFRYNTFGGDWTYKLGGRWSPVQDVTLRGTYSTAFRAPSIGDLYSGQSDNFANVSDPCRAADAPAACGDAADNGDDRKQLKSKIGGNSDLKPETAKIYTAGLVIQPRWVRNLSITVDYYDIAVTNALTTLGEAVILAGCYPTEAGAAPKYCDLVDRDAATKQITRITNTETNAGGENTSGVDIGIRYLVPTAVAGRFQLSLDASWLRNLDIIQADGTVVKARGNYDLSSQGNGGQGGVIPAWKFNAGVLWGLGPVTAGMNMRFIGSWHECGAPNGDFQGNGVCAFNSKYTRQVDAWSNWDLFVGYALKTAAGKTNIGLGVQNVFDTAPARVYNGFTAASDPTAYDFMGRYFYLRLTQSI